MSSAPKRWGLVREAAHKAEAFTTRALMPLFALEYSCV